MAYSYTEKKRIRKDFSKLPDVMDVPYLLAIQLDSYREFLQAGATKEQFRDIGLHAAFKSVFPIISYSGNAALEYVGYRLGEPAFDVKECVLRGVTFAVPLRVKVRLIIFDRESSNKAIKDIKEQEVYMGEIPLMTENGTFIINGTERVVVSQLHRSPGVFFDHDRGKTHSSGKFLYSARIIPYRGSWLDFEFDAKDLAHVRIDRRRKLPVTTLLLALGLDQETILNTFYHEIFFSRAGQGWRTAFRPDRLRGQKLTADLVDAATGQTLAEAAELLADALVLGGLAEEAAVPAERAVEILERGQDHVAVLAERVGQALRDVRGVVDEQARARRRPRQRAGQGGDHLVEVVLARAGGVVAEVGGRGGRRRAGAARGAADRPHQLGVGAAGAREVRADQRAERLGRADLAERPRGQALRLAAVVVERGDQRGDAGGRLAHAERVRAGSARRVVAARIGQRADADLQRAAVAHERAGPHPRRPGAGRTHGAGHRDGPGARRQAARAGRDDARPLGGAAGLPDPGRAGLPRVRGDLVAGGARAGENAAGDRRAAVARIGAHHQERRGAHEDARTVLQRGRHRAGKHRRGVVDGQSGDDAFAEAARADERRERRGADVDHRGGLHPRHHRRQRQRQLDVTQALARREADVLHAGHLLVRLGLGAVTHYYGIFESMYEGTQIQPYPADYNYNDEANRFGQAGRLWRQAAQPGDLVHGRLVANVAAQRIGGVGGVGHHLARVQAFDDLADQPGLRGFGMDTQVQHDNIQHSGVDFVMMRRTQPAVQ